MKKLLLALLFIPGLAFAQISWIFNPYTGKLDATATGAGSGTVTNVGGTGTVSGLTLTGTVTASGVLTLGGTLAGDDTAYNATTWNGSTLVPTQNSVRDKIEGLSAVYQPLTTNLTTYAGITPSADVQTFLGGADYAALRTQLGLVIGTNVQAFDADLTALAATSGTNTIYYRSADNTWTAVTIGTGMAFSGGTLSATGSGSGDLSSNTSSSVNSELALFSGTAGKTIKRATGTGLAGVTSGVFAAVSTSSDILTLVSDETGTDKIVASDSPTFTTQITAPKVIWTGAVTDLTGSGDPEGSVTAAVGSIYRRTDGGAATTVYVKEVGSGNTGWVAYGSPAGTGAPSTATYITQTANGTLSAEQAIGSLSSGFLSGTTTTGVVASRLLVPGYGMDISNSDGSGNPVFDFDPTEIVGSNTWGDGSTDTIVWTINRATGTDPTITFGSGSVGFQAISLTSALAVTSGGTGLASGTSGGVLYYASNTTLASSAALAQFQLVTGGGAAAAPVTIGSSGTSTTLLHGNASGLPSFSAVSLTADVSGDLPFANLTQGSALSVLGVTGNATADVASIAAGTDGQVLRRSGTTVAFGALSLSTAAAITGTLPDANIPSTITRDTEWDTAAEINAATTDDDFMTLTGSQTVDGAKTFNALTIGNALTFLNNYLYADAAMGALVVDTTELNNRKTISSDSPLTFSTTPATGTVFGIQISNSDTIAHTITIPSSKSEALGGAARTTFSLAAGATATVKWRYEGSAAYTMFGDPVGINDLTTATIDTDNDYIEFYDATDGLSKKTLASAIGGGSGSTSDTAYASSWNGVTTVSPSKNAVYDWAHTFDTDDDGLPDKLDLATAGLVRTTSGGVISSAELSGDATTSGSNAVTVVKINGVTLSGLATGLLKNTTSTGAPSIATAGTDYLSPTGTENVSGKTFTGVNFTTGTWATNANAMGALIVDVTKRLNTKSVTGPATLTFSGTPANSNQVFGVRISTDSTARLITIPSSFSRILGTTTTSFTVPASSTAEVFWIYDGSSYILYDEPRTPNELTVKGTPTTSDFVVIGDAAAGNGLKYATLGTLPTSASISDTAFASSWDAVTTIGPSKNAVYDYEHLSDTDDDGLPDKLDLGTAGLVRTTTGGVISSAELSGDASTSGSNAVTVTKINGTALSGLATGLVKNTTSTGVPSIATQGTDYWAPGGTDVAVADGGTGASTAYGAFDNLNTTETTVASATTTDIGAVLSDKVSITGTTTITGFGTKTAGALRWGRFTGALTLTHNATSLILPGATNITTAAGDRFVAISLGSGNWVVYDYVKASGKAVIPPAYSEVTSPPTLAPAFTTLTDGATITWTADATKVVQNATVTLGGNRTLAFASTAAGMSGVLKVVQDGTGSRTLTLPAGSKVIAGGSGAVTLTTTAAAIDILAWVYDGTNYFWTIGKNFN